jgi:putative membrane protein
MARITYIIKDVVSGYLIGGANIIPGVSGGTFLMILGIYERFIQAVNSLSFSKIRAAIKRFRSTKNSVSAESGELFFILRLIAGAVCAIATLSTLLEFLLEEYHTLTYAFFFGLILVSISIPYREALKKKYSYILFFIFGTTLSMGLSQAVSPHEKTLEKSHYYQRQLESRSDGVIPQEVDVEYHYSPRQYFLVFFSGALAMAAMILPGLSGSLILLVLGQYLTVIAAISAFFRTFSIEHALFLSSMALGMILGLGLFVKTLDVILKKFHDPAMYFLSGLIAGSLYALWPFKKTIEVASLYIRHEGDILLRRNAELITASNTVPPLDGATISAAACMLAGALIMALFLRTQERYQ